MRKRVGILLVYMTLVTLFLVFFPVENVKADGIPPLAYYLSSTTGLTVSFIDKSADVDGLITKWSWDFGDGHSSNLQDPTYQFADYGTYTVTLNVTDNDGLTDEYSKDINVSKVSPVADFIYSPSTPTISDVIQFTDISNDADGMIVAWFWSFGEGNTSYLQNPTYQFADDGTYTVTLNVTDNGGLTDEYSKDVTVSAIPPTADFIYSPSTPTILDVIQFTDSSNDVDGMITFWSWDFDDGNTSTQQNTSHNYPYGGSYIVTLTVTDDDGLTDSQSKEIEIVVTDSEPPSKVTGLSVTDAKDGKLKLIWNTSTDNIAIDHYKIYRNNVFLLNITLNSYQDTGLINGQSYTYMVSAVDTSGNEGNKSDPVSGIPTKSSVYNDESKSHNVQPINNTTFIDQKPTAIITGIYTGVPNEEIQFNATESHDNDENGQTIIRFDWKFSDHKEWQENLSSTPTYNYTNPGLYLVTLRVIDDEGNYNISTTTVTIIKPNYPPTTNFSHLPLKPTTNDVIQFTDLSSDIDGTIVSYYWNFSDGINSTEKNPYHQYNESGVYTITLKITDDVGAINTSSHIIFVEESQNTETNKRIPGFELVFAICAIASVILLMKKKRNT